MTQRTYDHAHKGQVIVADYDADDCVIVTREAFEMLLTQLGFRERGLEPKQNHDSVDWARPLSEKA